jgi:hypothetical protein
LFGVVDENGFFSVSHGDGISKNELIKSKKVGDTNNAKGN